MKLIAKEKLYDGIDLVGNELADAISDFEKMPCISTVKCIRDLSMSLLNLSKIDSHLMADNVDEVIPSKAVESEFTKAEAEEWVSNMITQLPDGSTVKGAHWTIDQTNAVAKQKNIVWEHIAPYHFWVTMNMIYSDYKRTANKYGVDTTDFYADMARAFLFDVDTVSPKEKLKEYYHHIVKPSMVK